MPGVGSIASFRAIFKKVWVPAYLFHFVCGRFHCPSCLCFSTRHTSESTRAMPNVARESTAVPLNNGWQPVLRELKPRAPSPQVTPATIVGLPSFSLPDLGHTHTRDSAPQGCKDVSRFPGTEDLTVPLRIYHAKLKQHERIRSQRNKGLLARVTPSHCLIMPQSDLPTVAWVRCSHTDRQMEHGSMLLTKQEQSGSFKQRRIAYLIKRKHALHSCLVACVQLYIAKKKTTPRSSCDAPLKTATL